MKLNIDENWLRNMAEKEDGCFISVGGLVHSVKEIDAMPPEDNPADEVQDIDAMKAYYDVPKQKGQRVTTVWRQPVVGVLIQFQARYDELGWFVNWDDGLTNDWCREAILIDVPE